MNTRDDQGAQGRAGGKDAVVGEEVFPGMGDEGGQSLDEGEGSKTKAWVPSRQGGRRLQMTLPSSRSWRRPWARRLGDASRAIEAYEAALNIDSAFPTAIRALAELKRE